MRCRIGTRKSALAKTQSGLIAAALEAKGIACELVEIVSEGDLNKHSPLYAIETDAPGLFCKQLEEALLDNQIDIAVHSLKDLPTTQPTGLSVIAVPAREDPADCLLIHPGRVDHSQLWKLTQSATVGTSSLRRESQLLGGRKDLNIVPLRGNVPTRVAQVREGKLDGAIFAVAGLNRLKQDLSGVVLVNLESDFVSAPAQGALGIEMRSGLKPEWVTQLRSLNDADTESNTQIERRIMKELEGGCTLPLGVLCSGKVGGKRVLRACLATAKNLADGRRDWVSIDRFDISGTDEDTLVAQTVRFFERKHA